MIKKVIFNTWTGAFFNPGGGEVQLLNTQKHLEKLGWTVDQFNQWDPQKDDTPVFHQFSIGSGSEPVMSEYRRLGKKIVLSTILWAEYPKDSHQYAYLNKILNLADMLMTNSDEESKKLSRAFDVDLKRFHKTRNSISEPYFDTKTNKDFRKEYRIESDFILSVANIDKRKNTRRLADACRTLGKKLVLVGHIRDQEYYEGLIDYYPEVKYVGPIADVDLLKSAFQSCALFALPSLCETPGIAALEAGSQGAKIVITNEGPTKEYFGDQVTYVDPIDMDSIIQGIEKELNQKRDSKKIREFIVSHYTWEQTAKDVIAGYSLALS